LKPPPSKPDDVVVGIDPNVFTGMTMLRGEDSQATKLITFPERKGIFRVHSLAIGVGSVIEEWSPRFVFIEGYAYGNKFTLVSCVEIGSAIRMELYRRKIPWFDVQPSTLKKWTTGSGNAKKPDMARAVDQRWKFTSESEDVVDSYALAKFGWTWLRDHTDQPIKHGG
jgi:crossover junction endodeoxyribonuclease RuvC